MKNGIFTYRQPLSAFGACSAVSGLRYRPRAAFLWCGRLGTLPAGGILVPQPATKPMSPVLEGGFFFFYASLILFI